MLVIQIAAGILLAVLIIVAFCLFLINRAFREKRRSEEHQAMLEIRSREAAREAEEQRRALEGERNAAWVAYYRAHPAEADYRLARELAWAEEDGNWPPGDDRGQPVDPSIFKSPIWRVRADPRP